MSTYVMHTDFETSRLQDVIERMSRSGRSEREIDAAVRAAAPGSRQSWWQRLKELAGAAAA